MNTQNTSVDLTQSGELNAIPWRDLNEKREFSDFLELALVDQLRADTGAQTTTNVPITDPPV